MNYWAYRNTRKVSLLLVLFYCGILLKEDSTLRLQQSFKQTKTNDSECSSLLKLRKQIKGCRKQISRSLWIKLQYFSKDFQQRQLLSVIPNLASGRQHWLKNQIGNDTKQFRSKLKTFKSVILNHAAVCQRKITKKQRIAVYNSLLWILEKESTQMNTKKEKNCTKLQDCGIQSRTQKTLTCGLRKAINTNVDSWRESTQSTKGRTRVWINAEKLKWNSFWERTQHTKNCCGLRKGINTKSNTKIVSADSGLNQRKSGISFLKMNSNELNTEWLHTKMIADLSADQHKLNWMVHGKIEALAKISMLGKELI